MVGSARWRPRCRHSLLRLRAASGYRAPVGVRGRLIAITTLVLGITVLVSLTLALRLDDADARHVHNERVEGLAQLMAEIASRDLRISDRAAAVDALVAHAAAIERERDAFGVVDVYVVDADGVDLAHATSPRREPWLAAMLASDGALSDPPPPQWIRRTAAPFYVDGRRYVAVVVIDAASIRVDLVARAQRLGASNVLISLLGLLVLLLLLTVEVLRPLQRLVELATHLGSARAVDLAKDVRGGSELRQLAAALADASERLSVQRDQLEVAVAVRTQELASANAELSSMNERLQQLALTDPLTGLFNRRALDQVLAHELLRHKRTQKPFAVMMIDVDHFKILNDTCGHAAGDDVLRRIARVVPASLRASDVVARVGGEEFVVLLLDTELPHATLAAEKVRVALRDANLPGGRTQPLGRVTVSIGVAACPDHGVDVDGVLAAADRALYQAKNAGRDQIAVAGATTAG